MKEKLKNKNQQKHKIIAFSNKFIVKDKDIPFLDEFKRKNVTCWVSLINKRFIN